MTSLGRICVVSLGLAACAPQAAPPAQHPSADQQAALADQDEQAARNYLSMAAAKRDQRCASGPKLIENEACWTPSSDGYRAAAQEHLRLAAAHRTAAQNLREAAARACEGISDLDRDVSPFAHTDAILRVEPIASGPHVDGARVYFRVIHGLSRASLQKIVDCHIAQADELGHEVPEEAFCPLNPPDVRAVVKDALDGFVIEVTSTDPDAGREVLRRALALKGPTPVAGAPSK